MGFIICLMVLNRICKGILSDPIKSSFYNTSSALLPIPALEGGFASLKWSAARHGVIALISALLIYLAFPENHFACHTILTINLVYTFLTFYRFFTRKKMVLEVHTDRPVPGFIKNLYSPSLVISFYCCYLMILLFAIYGIRP